MQYYTSKILYNDNQPCLRQLFWSHVGVVYWFSVQDIYGTLTFDLARTFTIMYIYITFSHLADALIQSDLQ